MKDILNRRVKHREPFRPFAPSVQAEHTGEYFEQDLPSPFMNLCFTFRERWRAELPAVDHVDHTGRLQTVERKVNERYWGLIEAFRRRTGVALVLNTSFNENEPIVCRLSPFLRRFPRALAPRRHPRGSRIVHRRWIQGGTPGGRGAEGEG